MTNARRMETSHKGSGRIAGEGSVASKETGQQVDLHEQPVCIVRKRDFILDRLGYLLKLFSLGNPSFLQHGNVL